MIQDEIERKQEHVLQEAHRLYCQAPDWATFFREIVGLRGLIRQVFPTRETFCAPSIVSRISLIACYPALYETFTASVGHTSRQIPHRMQPEASMT